MLLHGTTRRACVPFLYDQIPEPINRSVTMKSGLIVTRLEIFLMSPRWQQKSQYTRHAVTSKEMTEKIYLDETDLVLLILSSMNDTRTATNCPKWVLILQCAAQLRPSRHLFSKPQFTAWVCLPGPKMNPFKEPFYVISLLHSRKPTS